MPFNFDTMVDVKENDAGKAISTTKFNFSTIQPEPKPTIKEKRPSVISEVARWFFGKSLIEQYHTSLYLQDKMPELDPEESLESYVKKVEDVLLPREKAIAAEGIGKVLENEFNIMMGVSAVASPIRTALAVAGYAGLDKFINLRRFTDKHFPNTLPEIVDLIEVIDFTAKAYTVGGAIWKGENFIRNRMNALGQPKNVNVGSKQLRKINESGNILPEEKVDLMKTLGIEKKHIDASLNTGNPVNIPTRKALDLGKKPYWERCKLELQEDIVARENIPAIDIQPILKNIKDMQVKKKLSSITVSKLKKSIGIENIKKADIPQLEKLQSFLGDLKEGDKFLSEKQVIALNDVIKGLPNPEITPKRIIIDKFGEKDIILEGGVVGKVVPELIPTVDIKEGHPLVKKIVERASDKLNQATKNINARNQKLDLMLDKAEKSRAKLLPFKERLLRKVSPQNKEIFQALSGEKVKLTKEEVAVVAYLKNFFTKARKDLALSKYRKNYVTHLEQTLTEKIINDGLFKAIKGVLGKQKKTDIPIDIMLELDNIIGSEKFFRFALERKGGIEPTTNIRRIINQYSSLLETKKLLM